MNKKLLVGAVVVVGAYVGATAYVSSKTEGYFSDFVASANESLAAQADPSLNAKLVINSYEGGLFSSTANYSVWLEGELLDYPVEVVVKEDIYHGPLPLKALAQGSIKPVMAYSHSKIVENGFTARLFQLTDGKPPIYADSFYGFGGNIRSTVSFADAEFTTTMNSLTLRGASVNIDADSKFKNVELVAKLGDLNIQAPLEGIGLTLKNLHLDAKQSTNKEGLLSQAYKATLEDFNVAASTGLIPVTFGFHKLKSDGTGVETKPGVADGTSNYEIASVNIMGEEVGKLEQTLSFSNFAYKDFVELMQLVEAEENLVYDENYYRNSLKIQEMSQQVAQRILQQKPAVQLDNFSIASDAGKVALKGYVALNDPEVESIEDSVSFEMLESAALDFELDPKFVIKLLNSEHVPSFMRAEAIRGFEMAMDELVADNKLYQKDGKYFFSFAYEDAIVKLNEQQYSEAEFFDLLGN